MSGSFEDNQGTEAEVPVSVSPPVGRTVYPAKRNPDGYVAQRIAVDPDAERPWVLTHLTDLGQLQVVLLTDEDVADWAPLYDELVDDGDGPNPPGLLRPLDGHAADCKPVGHLSFEVAGASAPHLIERAHERAARFAAGLPYTLDTVQAQPYIQTGSGETTTWQADCQATVWPKEATQ